MVVGLKPLIWKQKRYARPASREIVGARGGGEGKDNHAFQS